MCWLTNNCLRINETPNRYSATEWQEYMFLILIPFWQFFLNFELPIDWVYKFCEGKYLFLNTKYPLRSSVIFVSLAKTDIRLTYMPSADGDFFLKAKTLEGFCLNFICVWKLREQHIFEDRRQTRGTRKQTRDHHRILFPNFSVSVSFLLLCIWFDCVWDIFCFVLFLLSVS